MLTPGQKLARCCFRALVLYVMHVESSHKIIQKHCTEDLDQAPAIFRFEHVFPARKGLPREKKLSRLFLRPPGILKAEKALGTRLVSLWL